MNHGFAYHDPMEDTPEGQLLAIVKQLENVVKSKNGSMAYMDKNMNCMGCKSDEGETCEVCSPNSDTKKSAKEGYKSDRGDGKMPNLPSPKGNKNMAGKSKKGKKPLVGGQKELDKDKDGDIDGDDFKQMKKGDATTQFLRERGIIVKYEQETSVNDVVPQLMEVSGSEQIRATVYSTNQRVPYMEDGPSRSPISEVAKMPSVAQTGYGADGSSLHMKLNDGGGVADNIDQWEEKLTQLKKSYPGKVGIIEEIASLTEQVYARL
jgi:hypothetical protein|tara:strand:+ start:1130 stop:1921 length:792 start_codon:yes stop_codon:yes gene_type:complete